MFQARQNYIMMANFNNLDCREKSTEQSGKFYLQNENLGKNSIALRHVCNF